MHSTCGRELAETLETQDMHVLVIDAKTDRRGLRDRVLTSRLDAADADAALRSLAALNPHVDLETVPAGTVLLVPDTPGFRPPAAAAGETTSATPLPATSLQETVEAALSAAAERLGAGNAARAAARADVSAALKTTALKRLAESDPDLKAQLTDAVKRFKDDQKEEDDAAAAVERTARAALAELAALAKLLR